MTFWPDGSVFLALILAPLTAGTLCGITGSGSAIVVQVMFRLFSSLLGISLADNEADASRRILAIAAVLSITQYPVAAYGIWKSPEKNIRWDAVVYLFAGLNLLVWIGTFIAMSWSPQLLLYLIGITLIFIACFQFVLQSILGRKVDDEKVKSNYRKQLNQKYQHSLASDDTHASTSTAPSSGSTTAPGSIPGTDLADLELGDIQPKQPTFLQAPNSSFDLEVYGNKTGLNLTLPKTAKTSTNTNTNTSSLPTILDGHQQSYGHMASIDNAIRVDTIHLGSDDDNGDDDDFAAISIDESHRLQDNRPLHTRIIDDAKNNPHVMIVGLITGCIAGIMGGMTGMNGPPIIMFLFYLKLNGAQLRDTSMMVFLSNLPCLLLARIVFKVFHFDEWFIYLVAITFSTCGLFLGTYLHSYCDTRVIMSCLQFVILLSSVTLTKPGASDVISGVFLGIYIVIALCAIAFIGWRMARNRLIKEHAKQQFYTLNQT